VGGMTPESLLRLLESVSSGVVSPAAAVDRLAWLPVEELHGNGATVARLDHHRALRLGHPEVVYCPGKTTEQVVAICERLAERGRGFLATRATPATLEAIRARFAAVDTNPLARTAWLSGRAGDAPRTLGSVLIVSAGTADLPVAEEAAVTAAALGNPVERLYDVGVAGMHRLLEHTAALRRAAVTIVVAGMEGALPSVVGGIVARPVIAVPTSVGYGANFGGVSALLSMLTSCAAGLTVVNIDNGFGAAFAATRINQLQRHPG
ncbi:MAG: nickel pincer cofactor biosynthesis protein LarB, partial [Longimicrobiales bacterium]